MLSPRSARGCRSIITISVALLGGSVARAEPVLFPVQGGVAAEFLDSSRVQTRTAQFSLAYVRFVAPSFHGWRLFAGAGPAVGFVYDWKHEGLKSSERLSWREGFSAGVELRFGLVYADSAAIDRRVTGGFGLPRFLVKAEPMWAPGVNAMGLPGDRGPAIRISGGFAWPMWTVDLLGVYGLLGVVLPTEIGYVFQHVPNDNQHGVSVGWSF